MRRENAERIGSLSVSVPALGLSISGPRGYAMTFMSSLQNLQNVSLLFIGDMGSGSSFHGGTVIGLNTGDVGAFLNSGGVGGETGKIVCRVR